MERCTFKLPCPSRRRERRRSLPPLDITTLERSATLGGRSHVGRVHPRCGGSFLGTWRVVRANRFLSRVRVFEFFAHENGSAHQKIGQCAVAVASDGSASSTACICCRRGTNQWERCMRAGDGSVAGPACTSTDRLECRGSPAAEWTGGRLGEPHPAGAALHDRPRGLPRWPASGSTGTRSARTSAGTIAKRSRRRRPWNAGRAWRRSVTSSRLSPAPPSDAAQPPSVLDDDGHRPARAEDRVHWQARLHRDRARRRPVPGGVLRCAVRRGHLLSRRRHREERQRLRVVSVPHVDRGVVRDESHGKLYLGPRSSAWIRPLTSGQRDVPAEASCHRRPGNGLPPARGAGQGGVHRDRSGRGAPWRARGYRS